MALIERDSVLTTDEAIEYLKISKPTFLKYIRIGRIRAIKAGKGWRILQSELDRLLKGEEELRHSEESLDNKATSGAGKNSLRSLLSIYNDQLLSQRKTTE
jgi:excisionase family DNA binding protein